MYEVIAGQYEVDNWESFENIEYSDNFNSLEEAIEACIKRKDYHFSYIIFNGIRLKVEE